MNDAELLEKAVCDNQLPNYFIMEDYFGLHNINNAILIFRVYQELFKQKLIDSVYLRQCFRLNQLDKMIHEKGRGPYYNLFLKKNLHITTP